MNHQAIRAGEHSFDGSQSRLLRQAAARLVAAHIEEPRLDAELLLAAACGQSRAWLLAHGDELPNEAVAQRFAGFVERRARHEPVAYILGHKEFYGLDLLVDRRVLIPRPETETLVDEALAWLRQASLATAAEPAASSREHGSLSEVPRSSAGLDIAQSFGVSAGTGQSAAPGAGVVLSSSGAVTDRPFIAAPGPGQSSAPGAGAGQPVVAGPGPGQSSGLGAVTDQPSLTSAGTAHTSVPGAAARRLASALAMLEPETGAQLGAAQPPASARVGRAENLTVIDVGTGSGAIALALAAHTLPDRLHIFAADVSPDALAVAAANAARHDLAARITFVQSDLLAGIAARANLITANLPYVTRAEWAALASDIRAYEPHLALDGGADGLELYRGLLAQAPARLAPGGALLLEIGWQQAAAVRALAQAAFPGAEVDIVQDLAGQDRVARIVPPLPARPVPASGPEQLI